MTFEVELPPSDSGLLSLRTNSMVCELHLSKSVFFPLLTRFLSAPTPPACHHYTLPKTPLPYIKESLVKVVLLSSFRH